MKDLCGLKGDLSGCKQQKGAIENEIQGGGLSAEQIRVLKERLKELEKAITYLMSQLADVPAR